MEYKAAYNKEARSQDFVLQMAEHISTPVTIFDHIGRPYCFRKFLWLGNWGIANANGTKVIVPAKANYLQAEILVFAKVLIAGNPNNGWDVYSLSGELMEHLSPMPFAKANTMLDERVSLDQLSTFTDKKQEPL